MSTIIDKLKLTQYDNLVVLNQPNDVDLFSGMKNEVSGEHDAIFVFVETIHDMVNFTKRIIKEECLTNGGYLYFAYPKKGNKRYETYVHRDEIFPAMKVGEDGYVENSDLKFSRMVSMDDVFTVVGLKRGKKGASKASASSQRVTDYEDHVSDIEALLADHPNELNFYHNLTPGYRRDWARYIFSAKQQKTREKRQEEMIHILGQGYKTIDLYRQKKK